MSALSTCQKCRGFVPPASAECVHCGAAMQASAPAGGMSLKGLFCLAGASMASITLMVWYGMQPCDKPAPDGGTDRYWCYDTEPHCASSAQDGGALADGGTATDGGDPYPCTDMTDGDGGTHSDGGVTPPGVPTGDAGVDAGP